MDMTRVAPCAKEWTQEIEQMIYTKEIRSNTTRLVKKNAKKKALMYHLDLHLR